MAALYESETEAEVVSESNSPPYGLASYVFRQNLRRASRVADALDAGMTRINRGVGSNPSAPFDGTKASGLGREGGIAGLEADQERNTHASKSQNALCAHRRRSIGSPIPTASSTWTRRQQPRCLKAFQRTMVCPPTPATLGTASPTTS